MNNIERQILKNQATILNTVSSLMKNNDLELQDMIAVKNRMRETSDALHGGGVQNG